MSTGYKIKVHCIIWTADYQLHLCVIVIISITKIYLPKRCGGNVTNVGFSNSEKSLQGDKMGGVLGPTEYLGGEVLDWYDLTIDAEVAVDVADDSLSFCNYLST